MKHGEVVEMEIPSAPEYVGIVRYAVEGLARRMAFDACQIDDIKLAVGEACTNAVRHGSPSGNGCNVAIRCVVMPDGLQVEVTNSTNCSNHPTVPTQPNLEREGGLGLFLIGKLVDEVQFYWGDGTATIRMLKRLAACSA